jgi:hypothetical protein
LIGGPQAPPPGSVPTPAGLPAGMQQVMQTPEFNKAIDDRMGFGARAYGGVFGHDALIPEMVTGLKTQFGVNDATATMMARHALEQRGYKLAPPTQPSPDQQSLIRPAQLDSYQRARSGLNPNLPGQMAA